MEHGRKRPLPGYEQLRYAMKKRPLSGYEQLRYAMKLAEAMKLVEAMITASIGVMSHECALCFRLWRLLSMNLKLSSSQRVNDIVDMLHMNIEQSPWKLEWRAQRFSYEI